MRHHAKCPLRLLGRGQARPHGQGLRVFVVQGTPRQVLWPAVGGDAAAGTATDGAAEGGDVAAEERGKRKQEIFDSKLAELVRQAVFVEVGKNFNRVFPESVIDGDAMKAATGDGRRVCFNRIAQAFWHRLPSQDQRTARAAVGYVESAIKNDEKRTVLPGKFYEAGAAAAAIRGLDDLALARLMFLCGVAHYGENESLRFGTNRRADQRDVLALAVEWEIDYREIDARLRLAETPRKYKWDAERYLAEVLGGRSSRTTELPEVWPSAAQAQRYAKLQAALNTTKPEKKTAALIRDPKAVRKTEAELEAMGLLDKPQHAEGDKVRVTAGPFKNKVATVVAVNPGGKSFKLEIGGKACVIGVDNLKAVASTKAAGTKKAAGKGKAGRGKAKAARGSR